MATHTCSNVVPVARCDRYPNHKTIRAKQIACNGVIQVFDYCLGCNRKLKTGAMIFIPHERAGYPLEELPTLEDYRAQFGQPCAVCGSLDSEYHHFAPRNIFGRDADRWPGAYLCRTHHAEWHNKMDGYKRYGRHAD